MNILNLQPSPRDATSSFHRDSTSRQRARLELDRTIGCEVASADVYHSLNLLWGIKPLLVSGPPETFGALVEQAESTLTERRVVAPGDKILVIGGVPAGQPRGSNVIKI